MGFYQSQTIEKLVLNAIKVYLPDTPVVMHFTREERSGFKRISHQQFPVNIRSIYPYLRNDEFVYTSFDRSQEDTVSLPIDFNDSDNFNFVKQYYNHRIAQYFRTRNILVEPTYIGDNQIWLKSKDEVRRPIKGCAYYDRYTIKFSYNDFSHTPQLILSYDRPGKIYMKSVDAFIKEYNVAHADPFCDSSTVVTSLLNRVLIVRDKENSKAGKKDKIYRITKYERLCDKQENGEYIDMNRVYPIINNKLAQFLGFDTDIDEDEDNFSDPRNRYDTYIPKIYGFLNKFILDSSFQKIIRTDTNFTGVEPGRVDSQSKQLIFGKDEYGRDVLNYVPRIGVNSGPYSRPKSVNIRMLVIAHEKDKQLAETVCRHLKQGYGAFDGLPKYIGRDYTYQKGILFKDGDIVSQVRNAFDNFIVEDGVKYIAIYFTPITKSSKDYKDRQVYYRIKEFLLENGIAVQCVESQKASERLTQDSNRNKNYFAYTLQNMSVAITAKLGGMPWRIKGPEQRELVIGVGAYKNPDDNVQYIGSAFSFDNTGAFNSFEYFHKDELYGLAGSIQLAIRQFRTAIANPTRLVIHYYKDMREDEVEIIEQHLAELDLDIPVYIVTINKTESKDIIVFDDSFDGKMPYSGRYINLGDGRFLLCNNTRYENSRSRIESYPFPVKLKIRCPKDPDSLSVSVIQGLIDQVYQFSRIYFKSVSQQCQPVTTKYPEMVAKIAPYFEGGQMPDGIGKDTLWFL